MLLETFERLLALSRKGATVIVEEALPGDVPGLYKLDERRARLEKLKAGSAPPCARRQHS